VSFTTLGRHRRLLRWWLPFAGTVLLRTDLPRADVELVVLRTACNCSSPYEWAQHVPLAARAGLSRAAINGVRDWRQRAIWSDRQRVLLAATDELHENRFISGGTWSQLMLAFDERQLIELCMLVGHYEMLAMTLNSLGVEPEPRALGGLGTAARDVGLALGAALDASRSEPAA
jgi:alkylhydroperoxidase family enzyme